jgi:hypothetical protein
MSKVSNKARYVQLIEWLESRKAKTVKVKRTFSKADHSKKVNKYYGAKNN